MGRDSGCLNTPNWIRNNILEFQRAMSMKISVKNGKDLKLDGDRREIEEN